MPKSSKTRADIMGSQEIRERWSLTSLQVQKRSFVLAVGAEER